MPVDQHGDYYDPNQYNGDATFNGRVKTNKKSKEEVGQDFFEDVFVPKVLPEYCPGLDFTESFNSMEMEPGEYVIETGSTGDGELTVYCDVCFPPEVYDRIMQQAYEAIEAPLKKAAESVIDGVGVEILSNDDNPEAPTITFQITVY